MFILYYRRRLNGMLGSNYYNNNNVAMNRSLVLANHADGIISKVYIISFKKHYIIIGFLYFENYFSP